MTPKVKRLFNEAKCNKTFQDELKVHEPDKYKPKFHWSDLENHLYCMLYMGWLIAKGEYNEKDYN